MQINDIVNRLDFNNGKAPVIVIRVADEIVEQANSDASDRKSKRAKKDAEKVIAGFEKLFELKGNKAKKNTIATIQGLSFNDSDGEDDLLKDATSDNTAVISLDLDDKVEEKLSKLSVKTKKNLTAGLRLIFEDTLTVGAYDFDSEEYATTAKNFDTTNAVSLDEALNYYSEYNQFLNKVLAESSQANELLNADLDDDETSLGGYDPDNSLDDDILDEATDEAELEPEDDGLAPEVNNEAVIPDSDYSDVVENEDDGLATSESEFSHSDTAYSDNGNERAENQLNEIINKNIPEIKFVAPKPVTLDEERMRVPEVAVLVDELNGKVATVVNSATRELQSARQKFYTEIFNNGLNVLHRRLAEIDKATSILNASSDFAKAKNDLDKQYKIKKEHALENANQKAINEIEAEYNKRRDLYIKQATQQAGVDFDNEHLDTKKLQIDQVKQDNLNSLETEYQSNLDKIKEDALENSRNLRASVAQKTWQEIYSNESYQKNLDEYNDLVAKINLNSTMQIKNLVDNVSRQAKALVSEVLNNETLNEKLVKDRVKERTSHVDDLKAKIRELEKENEKLNTELSVNKEKLRNKIDEIKDLEADLDDLEDEKAQIVSEQNKTLLQVATSHNSQPVPAPELVTDPASISTGKNQGKSKVNKKSQATQTLSSPLVINNGGLGGGSAKNFLIGVLIFLLFGFCCAFSAFIGHKLPIFRVNNQPRTEKVAKHHNNNNKSNNSSNNNSSSNSSSHGVNVKQSGTTITVGN